MKLFIVDYSVSSSVVLNSGADPNSSVMSVPTNAGPVVAMAYKALGTPYHLGGTTLGTALDCSGLTSICYAQAGTKLPRCAAAQYSYAQKQGKTFTYDPSQMKPGDQFFIDSHLSGKVSHTGLVSKVEGGKVYMIHAPHTGDVVREVVIDKYYLPRIIACARW